MAFKTRQFMSKRQQDSNQGSTILSHRKATLRKNILRNLHWQSSIFESLLLSTIKTIQRS